MGKRCERFCILDPGHDGACVPAEPLSWQATAERLQAEKLALREQLRGAVEALSEAVATARLFNRGGMTWLEYDRKLVEFERIASGGQ